MNIVFSNSVSSLSLKTAQDYCEGKQIQVSNPEYKSSTCNIFVVIVRKAIVCEFLVNQKQLDLQKKKKRNCSKQVSPHQKKKKNPQHRHYSHYRSTSELIVLVSEYSKLVKNEWHHFYSR